MIRHSHGQARNSAAQHSRQGLPTGGECARYVNRHTISTGSGVSFFFRRRIWREGRRRVTAAYAIAPFPRRIIHARAFRKCRSNSRSRSTCYLLPAHTGRSREVSVIKIIELSHSAHASSRDGSRLDAGRESRRMKALSSRHAMRAAIAYGASGEPSLLLPLLGLGFGTAAVVSFNGGSPLPDMQLCLRAA